MRRAREDYAWPVVTARVLEVYDRARRQARKEVEAGVHQ